MRILPLGLSALLVEVDPQGDVLSLYTRLVRRRADGVKDLVPAARTVLVRVDPHALPLSAARAWIEQAAAAEPVPDAAAAAAAQVVLSIAYDGPDLAETAALVGMSVEALVRRHQETAWTVAFTGFAPGFGYLIGDGWSLDVPRLASPRTRVPAGAVGLAGAYCGAYPRPTPGGWRLVGTTDAVLFDVDAADPALLVPGMRVRFREAPAGRGRNSFDPSLAGADRVDSGRSGAEEEEFRPAGAAQSESRPAAPEDGAIEVAEPGLLTTVQDLGRPGRAGAGIAVSGALDRRSLRTANRLVGNAEDAAALEITMGGFRARAHRPLWFAVAGAWGPIRLDGRELDPYQAYEWPAGTELELDWFARGARAYLAVRGGIHADVVAGSQSTDMMAGLGRAPLAAGESIAVGLHPAVPIPTAEQDTWGAPATGDLDLVLAPGPRADWFPASARAALFDTVWTVSAQADRVGIRLDGPALERARTDELPSEGMTPGALQVPPDGRPVILMADGPVTGGYPVIAAVTDDSLDVLAQARPGTRIRFRHAPPAD
ncbi:urea amidolyase family protein [Microbacterium kribbense]|uniref:Urea amidolyase family protein n=1 Tax=Microbacterium kribbense TaxID=433645 RepID=A0ABP7GUG1_9MICO